MSGSEPSSGIRRQGVTVTLYTSAGADGGLVVQIDTADDEVLGRLRVNVNDARVWGVDPTEHGRSSWSPPAGDPFEEPCPHRVIRRRDATCALCGEGMQQ